MGSAAGQIGELRAQHQGVDEEPDQVVERGVAAAARPERPPPHRRSRQACSSSSASAGLHHHEAGGVVLADHPGDGAAVRPATGPGRRRRAVRRPSGRAGRWVAGVARAARPASAPSRRAGAAIGLSSSVEFTELGALPQRVVDVLHRQRRPVGVPAPAHAARVRQAQVPGQRGHRPAVRGDVVHARRPAVHIRRFLFPRSLRSEIPARRTRKRCARSGISEGPGRRCDGWRRRRPSFSHSAVQPAASVYCQPHSASPAGSTTCWGIAVGRHQRQGSQALVPGDHVVQRGVQRLGVEGRPTQAQRRGHVVQPPAAPEVAPGTTTGSARRTAGSPRGVRRPPAAPVGPASSPMRGASSAMVGASKMVRTARLACRLVLTAAMSAHGGDAVPAEVEEGIVDTDSVRAQHLGHRPRPGSPRRRRPGRGSRRCA